MFRRSQPESDSDPEEKKAGIKEFFKSAAVRGIAAVSLAALGFFWFQSEHSTEVKKFAASFSPYNEFVDKVNAKKIPKVIETETSDGEFILQGTDGAKIIRAKRPSGQDFYQVTKDSGVSYLPIPREKVSPLTGFFTQWWPLLLTMGVLYFIYARKEKQHAKQMENMGVLGDARSGTLGMGKSKAKLVEDQSAQKVRFADVAGADEAKAEVYEVVEFLKDPEAYQKMGGTIPNGLLLAGGPGLGKTLLAKAMAGEAKVPFYSIAGSDFVEMLVGVGAARVRDMFEEAKKNAPCIIFIDEIDAVGRARGGANSNDERENTLNQMLVEMDGFEPNSGVMIIAATNRADILDPALLRRFTRQVVLHPPDLKGRLDILQVHARKMNKIAHRKVFGKSLDFEHIARMTRGMSGADLATLLNESAFHAVRRKANFIHMADVLEARDKIQLGFKRPGLKNDAEQKRKIACHEAGHALCAYLLAGVMKGKVDKITIMPRSKSLGHTSFQPDADQNLYTKEHLKARLVYLFGGRMAELVHYNEKTTGASNDIERITKEAREIIMMYGMSDVLPPRNYYPDTSRTIPIPTMSEWQARQVDKEINELIKEAEAKARQMIEGHAEEFKLLWDGVDEFETLEMEDVEVLMNDRSMDRLKEVRAARDAAMKESMDSDAEESLHADADDPPANVDKRDLWKHTPR